MCARIKEQLLKEFNLHTIVRLPNGVFAPYTSIPTNLLFFDRSGPTKTIWYYELPLPEGRKQYTKTKPLQYEEFAGCLAWCKKKRRDENGQAWKVTAGDVLKYDESGGPRFLQPGPKKPYRRRGPGAPAAGEAGQRHPRQRAADRGVDRGSEKGSCDGTFGMTGTEIVTLTVAIVGAVCGVLGTALGIINTIQQFQRDRVKLRVIPRIAFPVQEGGLVTATEYSPDIGELLSAGAIPQLCIEIVNQSSFPVTVFEVGFGKLLKSGRQCLVMPGLDKDRPWPVRLDSREAVTAYATPEEARIEPDRLGKAVAYALTECGKVFYGSSPIFTEYVRQLRNSRERSA